MSPSFRQNKITRILWQADSLISSAAFELVDGIKRGLRAYSSFMYRFRISGLKRFFVDIIDDGISLVTAAAVLVLLIILPVIPKNADVWNRDRPYAMTFTDPSGQIIGRRGIRQDDAIPLSDIQPHMINALLATEDVRFHDHFGIDVRGTLRALVHNAQSDGSKQGGSSLTQQLAKNLFLKPDRTFKRKLHEAILALWIESRLTKDQILKLYLDRSYMGGGTYGVEAASQYYFGKSIRDVTLGEAAMLAGLFKAPSKYAPHVDLKAARGRSNVVLNRMLDAGFVTQGDVLAARRENIVVIDQKITEAPNWFLDQAYRDALAIMDEQHLTDDFVLEIRTTIDLKLQQASQRIIDEALLTEGEPLGATQAASVTLAHDGAVRAIVGGRNYENNQFNRATSALRQPGSSFKPFVYLAALINGFTPDTIVTDGPVTIGSWSPRNYSERYAGQTTLRNALAHSYNSVPVRLALQTTRAPIIEIAMLAGIMTPLKNVVSLPLGTSEVTLFELTSAYNTFANAGARVEPYIVMDIRRPNGQVLYDRTVNGTIEPVQVFPPDKVAGLNDMMNAVVTSGTGRRADLAFEPVAGKTGTNQSYKDAWFVGFSGNATTGVWFGNDDTSSMKEVTGGLLPAPTWRRIMIEAERGQPAVGLPGVPLDPAFAQVARAEIEAENAPVPAIATAFIGPPAPSDSSTSPQVAAVEALRPVILRGPVHDAEIDASARAPDAPADVGDDTASTLQGVFGLFDNPAPETVSPPVTITRPRPSKRKPPQQVRTVTPEQPAAEQPTPAPDKNFFNLPIGNPFESLGSLPGALKIKRNKAYEDALKRQRDR